MAEHRTRKSKENPHYRFLVSWQPPKTHVKGESNLDNNTLKSEAINTKRADNLGQQAKALSIKKDIFRSLILVSLILIVELVVYLARNSFIK